MTKVDLEQNLAELEEYTERETAREFALLERHLINIYKGEKVAFCVACVQKHLLSISGLAGECLEGSCKPQKIWQDIVKWAKKVEEKVETLGVEKEETLKLAQEAREFRKALMEGVENLKDIDILPHQGKVLEE